MKLANDIRVRLRDAAGFVFDMDGTIALGDAASGGHKALPHAIELLGELKARGTPFVVFTNGSAKEPAAYAASLRAAGFPLEDWQMLTPSSSAARWLGGQGLRRVRVLGNQGTAAPLRAAGLEVVGPAEEAGEVDAVFTGWHRDFGFPDLEAACHSIWGGARLVTASHVPFFAAAGGRAIGASFAINAMITALTGKRARVLAKPSRAALDTALAAMGLPRKAARQVVVVGDDAALEMRMANAAGATGVALTTGMIKRGDTFAERDRPAALLDSLEPLRAALA